jgi:hypothetical protein
MQQLMEEMQAELSAELVQVQILEMAPMESTEVAMVLQVVTTVAAVAGPAEIVIPIELVEVVALDT